MKYYQTGDILYKECDVNLKGMKLQKSNLIKLGTASGHAHTLGGDGKIYQDKEDMYIVAGKNTTLEHNEHNTIALPKGKYKVEVVKEYDHFEEESREVVD